MASCLNAGEERHWYSSREVGPQRRAEIEGRFRQVAPEGGTERLKYQELCHDLCWKIYAEEHRICRIIDERYYRSRIHG